jgi:hypothetical protein
VQGLQFQSNAPPTRSDPARADIACFVGFVACRAAVADQRRALERALRGLGWDGPSLPDSSRVLPDSVAPSGSSPAAFPEWLRRQGWTARDHATRDVDLFRRAAAGVLNETLVEWWVEQAWLAPFGARSAADLLELSDVPAPIDTWDSFDALFAWDRRPIIASSRSTADTTLGMAVRRFFLQGGRKCYVVRVGDPLPAFDSAARASLRTRLLGGAQQQPTPVDRSTWRGVAHLFGLPDVSFLSTPDLPELFAAPPGTPVPVPELVDNEERFVECGVRSAPPDSQPRRLVSAPRCDETGFLQWADFVKRIGRLLAERCPEVQYVAAVPLPADDQTLRSDPTVTAIAPSRRARETATRVLRASARQRESAGSIQTAFVQLTYPWLLTRESGRMPGGLEPPDAMLVGMLASNALVNGTWQSIARTPAAGIVEVEPVLRTEDLVRELPYRNGVAARRLPRTLQERVSVFGETAVGFRLLSDVTTDDDEAYRPASVNRLVASILRAARLIGEDATFSSNGDVLWRRVRSTLERLLLDLWGSGALDGASSADAFDVRCDRSSMTRADLDAGRVVVRVQFKAATPIQQITVVFAMDEGGQVTLVPRQAPEPVSAA